VWGVPGDDSSNGNGNNKQSVAHSNAKPVGVHLGTFTYDQRGAQVQTFALNPTTQRFSVVTVGFLSNYGNKGYTCIYRVRVHGQVTNDNGAQSLP
jgi:hypothetical protein